MIVGAIALIAMYLGGGGGQHLSVFEMLNEMSTVVEAHVEDPARAEAAEQTLVKSRAAIEAATVELDAYREELMSTGMSDGLDAAALETIFAEISQLRKDAERAFIRGQIELRDHVTAEEWGAMYADLKEKRE